MKEMREREMKDERDERGERERINHHPSSVFKPQFT